MVEVILQSWQEGLGTDAVGFAGTENPCSNRWQTSISELWWMRTHRVSKANVPGNFGHEKPEEVAKTHGVSLDFLLSTECKWPKSSF